jgi:hypothetical protein
LYGGGVADAIGPGPPATCNYQSIAARFDMIWRRLLDAKKIAQACTLYADKSHSIADICRTLKI